jgi:hypothetical protein
MALFIAPHLTLAVPDPREAAPSVDIPQLRPRQDRRDLPARDALVQRVACEFREIPGLCVTLEQAARLFGLPTEECQRVLSQLVDAEVLQCAGNHYRIWRADVVGESFTFQTHERR